MKANNIFKISTLSFLMVLCLPLFSQIQTFEWQGVQRQYLVRSPQHTDKSTTPVLYFLHGWTDNITHVDNEFHFQQIANLFEWTIVIPQALDEGSGTMWNAGLYASNTDDSGFLMALLDSLVEPYSLNLDSVFFTGFSMGGFMTHRMAIEHGDRITACAPVSGLITHSMANQTAIAPVRMLYIHGTSDPVVGYSGTSQYFGNLGLGADAIIDYWKIGYMNEIHRFFVGDGGGNVGIAEPEQKYLNLWPNTTSGCFTIKVESATDIEVMDCQGLCVGRLKPGANSIDLSGLTEGLYFIKGANGIASKVLLTK